MIIAIRADRNDLNELVGANKATFAERIQSFIRDGGDRIGVTNCFRFKPTSNPLRRSALYRAWLLPIVFWNPRILVIEDKRNLESALRPTSNQAGVTRQNSSENYRRSMSLDQFSY